MRHFVLVQITLTLLSCAPIRGRKVLKIPESFDPVVPEELVSPITASIDPTFLRFALEAKTDKVSTHSYHYLYSKYLAGVRNKALDMLEIGLGCDMDYGPGHSLQLWRRYLPRAKISFVEYDAACATKYKKTIEAASKGTLYIGDQADVAFLATVASDSRGLQGYDIIIDDGGHTAHQMLTSFSMLWSILKPGGMYVVEDIEQNYNEGAFSNANKTFISTVKSAIDAVHCRTRWLQQLNLPTFNRDYVKFCGAHPLDIVSVECMPEACVLIKGLPRQHKPQAQ